MEFKVYSNRVNPDILEGLNLVNYPFRKIITGYTKKEIPFWCQVEIPCIFEVLDWLQSKDVWISTNTFYDSGTEEFATTYSILFNIKNYKSHTECDTFYSELYYALNDAIKYSLKILAENDQ